MEFKYIDKLSANCIFNEFKTKPNIDNASYSFSGSNLRIHWNERGVNCYLIMTLGESITIHDDYFYIHGSRLDIFLNS